MDYERQLELGHDEGHTSVVEILRRFIESQKEILVDPIDDGKVH